MKTGHWFWLHDYAAITNASTRLSAIDLPQPRFALKVFPQRVLALLRPLLSGRFAEERKV